MRSLHCSSSQPLLSPWRRHHGCHHTLVVFGSVQLVFHGLIRSQAVLVCSLSGYFDPLMVAEEHKVAVIQLMDQHLHETRNHTKITATIFSLHRPIPIACLGLICITSCTIMLVHCKTYTMVLADEANLGQDGSM